MKRTEADEKLITVVGEIIHATHIGEVCIFHIYDDSVKELLQPGSLWKRMDGGMFVIDKVSNFTNCFNYPYEQVGIVFKSSSVKSLNQGDVLYPVSER